MGGKCYECGAYGETRRQAACITACAGVRPTCTLFTRGVIFFFPLGRDDDAVSDTR
jgi:hypothetical protein